MLCDNIIATPTHRNVITGGETNSINPGAAYSFVGGGICNTVSGACAVIAGGCNNTVTGPFSAILGGNNNNDGGLANVHIAGSGITAVLPNTLHVNALWAGAIPNIPGGIGALPGQIYWDTPPAPNPNPRALYIGI